MLCNAAPSQDRPANGKAAGKVTKLKTLDLHALLCASYGRAQGRSSLLELFFYAPAS